MKPQIHLAFDFSKTHLEGRWRSPGSWVGHTYPSPDLFEEVARIAERGCMDMIFFGDGTGVASTWGSSTDAAAHWGVGWPRQDMSPFIVGMARVTKHLGFGLTYSSTFMHPYYVSRLLNSLDHVTGGRMAFNVVASTRRSDAANYGFDELMEHGQRYERMEEFVDICKALWSSVGPDAFKWDRESGMVADPAKVHAINHVGKHFRVKGPLSVVPSPQGRPILIQAGGSPRGIAASAHFADAIFAEANSQKGMTAHRAELDRALIAEGRDPSVVGVLWSTGVIVAESKVEAQKRRESLLDLLPEEGVGALLSDQGGYDFSTLPDKFSPGELNHTIAANNASPVGFVHKVAQIVGENTQITRKEFLEIGRRDITNYDKTFADVPSAVADHLEEMFEAGGSRGGFMFNSAAITPYEQTQVVDLLIPELRRRDVVRKEYTGKTLRENLNVPAF
jgi:FMN-dependent oxidoreductase (nitrilotriacetate monooxygenase family)